MSSQPTVTQPTPPRPSDWHLPSAQLARLTRRIVSSGASPMVTTLAPYSGQVLAELPTSSKQDVAAAVARARAAQPAWAARDVHDRAAVLLRLHDLVLERRSEVLDLIQLETGKARAHAYEEVADVAINARYYARRGPALLADSRRAGLVPGLTSVREVHHPRGVVGVIAPWNYPLTLSIADSLPALLAGNAVVIKPDTQTALTALWGVALLTEAGVPEDVLAVVVGEGTVVGPALVAEVDYVCFTGSTPTGRAVAQQAAARLVGASLELGGKNALYVADDADLDRAAEAAVRDCFASTGQLCVSMERLLLHERVADAFLDRFVDRVRHMRLGAALDYSKDLGSLTSSAQLLRVSAHVEDAVGRGATVLTGGKARPDLGPYFYEPTVLDHVPAQAQCFAQETFGPVVSVHRVASDSEAVARANDTEYGLNASVWTRDTRRGALLARQIRAGTVTVNEAYIASWGSVASPMGGRKSSGLGRRHGAEGLLRFTESQTVTVQRGVGFAPLYSLGGERFSVVFSAALRAARKVHAPWP